MTCSHLQLDTTSTSPVLLQTASFEGLLFHSSGFRILSFLTHFEPATSNGPAVDTMASGTCFSSGPFRTWLCS